MLFPRSARVGLLRTLEMGTRCESGKPPDGDYLEVDEDMAGTVDLGGGGDGRSLVVVLWVLAGFE
ncbi:hypothetical protein BJQ89_01782 [Arthrobacter sp. ES1]|nr:hypothetical protein [Arthrobacter sp. ES1]